MHEKYDSRVNLYLNLLSCSSIELFRGIFPCGGPGGSNPLNTLCRMVNLFLNCGFSTHGDCKSPFSFRWILTIFDRFGPTVANPTKH